MCRLFPSKHRDHLPAQGVANEEVAFGIAEPMVAVAGLGRQFLGAGKLRGRYKASVGNSGGSGALDLTEGLRVGALFGGARKNGILT